MLEGLKTKKRRSRECVQGGGQEALRFILHNLSIQVLPNNRRDDGSEKRKKEGTRVRMRWSIKNIL